MQSLLEAMRPRLKGLHKNELLQLLQVLDLMGGAGQDHDADAWLSDVLDSAEVDYGVLSANEALLVLTVRVGFFGLATLLL